MDDQRIGAVVREVRRRRGLRQRDLAEAAGVSRATVSLVERGHIASLSLDTLRRISAAVDVRIDLVGRWRGGDLDRLLSRRHSLLAESFAAWVSRMPGWIVEPEVSFSIYGERGIIDLLAWHAEAAHLLLVEFKTALVDNNELLGTIDRKRRLIQRIAADRGWQPQHLSVWLIVTDTSTNRRDAREHATLLRSRFPRDGRQLRGLLRDPASALSGLAFWSDANRHSTKTESKGSTCLGRTKVALVAGPPSVTSAPMKPATRAGPHRSPE
jgi:transcriptional regulator with XRE-family HTH domain